jgi:hypothetical protein
MHRFLAACFLSGLTSQSMAQDIDFTIYRYPTCQAFIESRIPQTSTESFDKGYCAGILQTMIWLGPTLSEGSRYCPPVGVTVGQSTRVMVKFVEGNLARQNEPFDQLAMQAFQQAWPCR